MARISLAIVAAVLLLGTTSLHAQPAQLITNGSLDVDASGWTLGGGCGDEQWDGANGNPPGSIRLNACGEADSDPAASQTIGGLTIGATYTISVDVHLHVASSGSGTGKSFGIFLNSEPGTPLVLTEFLDGNWHTLRTKFTAASTSATIIFAGELDARTPGGPGSTTDVSYFIDNISVTQATAPGAVPTLSTYALLALGVLIAIGAMLLLRRGSRFRRDTR